MSTRWIDQPRSPVLACPVLPWLTVAAVKCGAGIRLAIDLELPRCMRRHRPLPVRLPDRDRECQLCAAVSAFGGSDVSLLPVRIGRYRWHSRWVPERLSNR